MSLKTPFYRKLLKSRKNAVNTARTLKFNKEKWKIFNSQVRKNHRFFKRYKYKDQIMLRVGRFSSYGNRFKKHYRNFLTRRLAFQLMYGDFKKKKLKKIVLRKNKEHLVGVKKNDIIIKKKQKISSSLVTLLRFEKRLDVILYRSKFSYSVKQARQMILHGHVLVNNKTVRTYSCYIKYGDSVSIAKKHKSRLIVQRNLLKAVFWPIPHSFLNINYKTLKIINTDKGDELFTLFLPFQVDIQFIKNKIKFAF